MLSAVDKMKNGRPGFWGIGGAPIMQTDREIGSVGRPGTVGEVRGTWVGDVLVPGTQLRPWFGALHGGVRSSWRESRGGNGEHFAGRRSDVEKMLRRTEECATADCRVSSCAVALRPRSRCMGREIN